MHTGTQGGTSHFYIMHYWSKLKQTSKKAMTKSISVASGSVGLHLSREVL